ncbi:DNA methylase N-4/N-6 [uncultured Caudovirales phage]|uniref:DNA methylase N-4/N-6 n=1 Tax=uncultured Caudovirales phage TaxID=2100421 RepID=A0A6J5L2I4_9CAUD|nr:DNA methylase N-4/N-6 [uncultured Caudovirales phage]
MNPVIIGNATLYLGDCMEVLPTLGRFDAVITDPPYGISVDREMANKSGTQYGKAAAPKGNYFASGWDDKPMSYDMAQMLVDKSSEAIFWGGNYYGMPPSSCWLVWDKKNGTNNFADCELAWTNIEKPVRKIEWMWNGMLRQGGEERNGHPTQKPLAVMVFSIEQCIGNPQTILDPFMGSGTTGVAAIQLGRSFTGIEREPKYFDIACERISKAAAQGQLFEPEPMKQVQETFL